MRSPPTLTPPQNLRRTPTEDHANIICNTLEEFKKNNELVEDIAEGRKPLEPRTPRFYLFTPNPQRE